LTRAFSAVSRSRFNDFAVFENLESDIDMRTYFHGASGNIHNASHLEFMAHARIVPVIESGKCANDEINCDRTCCMIRRSFTGHLIQENARGRPVRKLESGVLNETQNEL
jgi:hypothetical protein